MNKLLEALRPFAKWAEGFGPHGREDSWVIATTPTGKILTMGDVRLARAVFFRYRSAPADTAVRDAVPRIPREPTEAMMNAVRGWKILEEIKRNLWRAMYDAASLQDQQKEPHGDL